jgi:hypothetical protein
MIVICPACRAAHVQGTLFCEQCGGSLIGVAAVDETATATKSTGAFPPAPPPRAPAPAPAPLPRSVPDNPPSYGPNGHTDSTAAVDAQALRGAAPVDPDEETPGTLPLAGAQDRDSGRLAVGSAPTRLRVLVLNTGRLTDWIDDPVIHVGRSDRSANVFPNIDLETDGGHNAGVSRRHVRISRQPDGYYLEDLGSINGTFLNRRRLSPGAPTELKDGDEVRMGNIVLRIVLGGFQRTH